MTSHHLAAVALSAGYDQRAVVQEISLEVRSGEIVVLSGANGAGKSTLLHCLAGRIGALSGSTTLDGRPLPPNLERRARSGILLVPEERSIFRTLTVEENLRMSGRKASDLLGVFPELEEHLPRKAGLLSGGQQQMLSLARALGCQPKVLLIDELTLGLAPIAVGRLLDSLRSMTATTGIGVLLVEQHVRRALTVADRGYVLAGGRVVIEGDAASLTRDLTDIEQSYLGGLPEEETPRGAGATRSTT